MTAHGIDQAGPFVTIGVAAYNAEAHIGETLESLLAQDFPNREILVSDNASTDRTEAIVRSYAARGVRYHRQAVNVGPGENFNWLIRSAKGDPVAIYHAEEIYAPTIVSRQVEFLLRHPGMGAVFTLDYQIDAEGRAIGQTRLPGSLAGREIFKFPEFLIAIMAHGNGFIRCPSLMIRKEAFEKAGPFDEIAFGSAADVEMWIRINRHFPIGLIPEPLFVYRLSERQHTHRVHHGRTEPWDHFKAVDRHLADVADTLPRGLLRDYEDHKMNDIAVGAANGLILGRADRAIELLDQTVSGRLLAASLGSPRRLLHFLVRLGLLSAARLGLGRPAAIALRKVV